jgi:hypothetical protein
MEMFMKVRNLGRHSSTQDLLILASLHATVSASFTIEQEGLPVLTSSSGVEEWNGRLPGQRLEELKVHYRNKE